MVNLEKLDLYGTQVTDQGLIHLEQLPKLRSVGLRGTNVTDDNAKRLHQVLREREIPDFGREVVE